MRRSKSKPNSAPKCVLRLPDLEHAKLSVLNTLVRPNRNERAYRFATDDFTDCHCLEPQPAFAATGCGLTMFRIAQKHMSIVSFRHAYKRRPNPNW
jgi:hypothetical protein